MILHRIIGYFVLLLGAIALVGYLYKWHIYRKKMAIEESIFHLEMYRRCYPTHYSDSSVLERLKREYSKLNNLFIRLDIIFP